jgi:pimeloyl-ACP methyl ester carboxylesterase
MASESQTKTILNVNVHYELYPPVNKNNKKTVVLIHGFLSSTFSFRRLIPLLRKNFTVIAVDLPGFGKSDKSKAFHYSLENYGKLIVELLHKIGVAETIVIGHSMGGQVALHAAKQAPDLVKKLILLSSSGYLSRSKRSLVYSSYLPFFTRWVRKTFERRGVKSTLLTVVHDHSLIDQQLIDGYHKPLETKAFFESLIRFLRQREGDLSENELKTIQTPTLFIWGEEDKIVPLRIGKRLTEDLPDARLIVYEETGHLVPEEKPKEVYHDVLHFIGM